MEFLQNLISLPGDEMVHVVSFPRPGAGIYPEPGGNRDFRPPHLLVRHYHHLRAVFGGVPLLQMGAPLWHRPDHIIDLMIFAVPAALVAIRAYYVIFNLSLYQNADGSLNWGRILSYGDGGLAIYGAIISSAIVLLIFCHVRKISFLPSLTWAYTGCSSAS